MKQCKCEHWQQCPICMPHRFDAEGNVLPPEPTPLQAARDEVARLTAELARSYAYAKTLEQEVFDAETKENEATELWEKERCFSQDLIKQLTETRDLAEHWMIIAEQRRMELGECRKDAGRYRWIKDRCGRGDPIMSGKHRYWITVQPLPEAETFDAAIDAAMEAKP